MMRVPQLLSHCRALHVCQWIMVVVSLRAQLPCQMTLGRVRVSRERALSRALVLPTQIREEAGFFGSCLMVFFFSLFVVAVFFYFLLVCIVSLWCVGYLFVLWLFFLCNPYEYQKV
uniref:T. congolense-specific, cell surface-expressed gene family n=1 Tax=Trypanosoma congolense (strain IL3000) TaxID=1068625 RepID=G0UQG3_TRYCI|nr:hypothetical protein, unlikely [Trypanosoma congolense IL3000]